MKSSSLLRTRWKSFARFLARCLVAIVPAALCGCALAPAINQNAVAYNKTLEQTANSLLLLNAVRASYDMPLYFSRFGGIDASLSASAGISSGGEFSFRKGDGLQNYTLSPNIEFGAESRPTFSIDALDTQEFYSGLLDQISPEIFQYYWDRGFPKELLVLLLVERIDVRASGDRSYFFDNFPPRRKAFASFVSTVEEILAEEPELVVEKGKPRSYGPPVPPGAAGTLGALVEAHKAKIEVASVRGGIQLQDTPRTYALRTSEPPRSVRIAGGEGTRDRTGTRQAEKRCDQAGYTGLQIDGAIIRLRSVQGLIYYLGELIRVQASGDLDGLRYVPRFRIDEGEAAEPIFLVTVDGGRSSTSVSYRGRSFSLPEGAEGRRSMQTLALLSELFALKLKGTELPRSRTVLLAN